MWNKDYGYLNKQDFEICNKHAVKVDMKILKIYHEIKYGYDYYYMWYSLENDKVFRSIIDFDTYKYLKDFAKVLTSQKLSRLRK